MKRLTLVINLLAFGALIALNSCGALFFIETDCREFEFNVENYWFTDSIGTEITYTDSLDNEKSFIVKDRQVFHTSKYYTDTGCGCSDVSLLQLRNENDTISLWKDSFYQYDNDADLSQYIHISFGDTLVSFSHSDIIDEKSIVIDSTQIENCIIFQKKLDDVSNNLEIVLSENQGIIKMIDYRGNIWTIKNLNNSPNSLTLDDFEYFEEVCE